MIKVALKHKIIDMCLNVLFEYTIDNFMQRPKTILGCEITRGCEGLYVYYATDKHGNDIRNRCSNAAYYIYPFKIHFASYHEHGIESLNLRGDIVLNQTVPGSFGYKFADSGLRVKNDDTLYLIPRINNA